MGTGLSRAIIAILLPAIIIACALSVYTNNLDAPFLLDDDIQIVNNPLIKNLSIDEITTPSKDSRAHPMHGLFMRRIVSFVSFSMDHRTHGLDPKAFHTTGMLIHILASLLVYLLMINTLKTPGFEGMAMSPETIQMLALASGLIFATHPLQTESVMYISARTALLAGLFSILSILCYARFRFMQMGGERQRALEFYALCLISAVLAVKSKDNAAILPVLILLYEFTFFPKGSALKRILFCIPLFAAPLLVISGLEHAGLPLETVLLGAGNKEAVSTLSLGAFDKAYLMPKVLRSEYLVTQFGVVLEYMRLWALPINQNFGYAPELKGSLLRMDVLAPLLTILGVIVISLKILICKNTAMLRLVAFGVLWFFLALFIESSIIPIPILMAEYRTYLPMAGIAMGIPVLLWIVALKFKGNRKLIFGILIVPLLAVFILLANQRAHVFTDKVNIWADTVNKAPRNIRARTNLGIALIEDGHHKEAIKEYRAVLELAPENTYARTNLGRALMLTGDNDGALGEFGRVLESGEENAQLHVNMGIILRRNKNPREALKHYVRAIELNPGLAEAYFSMGNVLLELGRNQEAVQSYKLAIANKPARAFRKNLAVAYDRMGMREQAARQRRLLNK